MKDKATEMLEGIADYLKDNALRLATAESCTAGLVVSELARIPGSGGCLDCGLAVYSPESKNRYLNVSFDTIDQHGLTSEPVALEMAMGAIDRNDANIALSNTGVAGPASGDDDTPVGTVCFAWAVRRRDKTLTYTETRHFDGDRNEVRLAAAHYALQQLPRYHRKAMDES
ncbi:MAG: ompetence-damaged protein [Alteromonadaceae bacterium]|nr:ompetence-damaged protein [Alteromonadaceae bacterium]|tara:strand:- start:1707 stop:2219 length:513 start_codon:yes stop_codon:yes gene_type:complete